MLYLLAANSLKCSISVYCLFMLHVDLTWGRWQTLCGRCGEGKVWGNLWKCGRLPSPSSERPETPHYHRRHQCISPAHRLTTLRTAGRTDGRPTLWPVHGPEGEGGGSTDTHFICHSYTRSYWWAAVLPFCAQKSGNASPTPGGCWQQQHPEMGHREEAQGAKRWWSLGHRRTSEPLHSSLSIEMDSEQREWHLLFIPQISWPYIFTKRPPESQRHNVPQHQTADSWPRRSGG